MVSRIVRPSLVRQPGDLIPHVGAHLGVEPGRRLVEEQHLRAVDERPSRCRAGAACHLSRPRASAVGGVDLADGKGTVGFEVCIKHVGGAPEGTGCTVYANLREIVEDPKLRFDVEVRSGERVIGVGTHERRVIDLAAHATAGS